MQSRQWLGRYFSNTQKDRGTGGTFPEWASAADRNAEVTVRHQEQYPGQFMPAAEHAGVLLTPLEISLRLAADGERRTLQNLCAAISVTRRALRAAGGNAGRRSRLGAPPVPDA
jgi:hypothetical protein